MERGKNCQDDCSSYQTKINLSLLTKTVILSNDAFFFLRPITNGHFFNDLTSAHSSTIRNKRKTKNCADPFLRIGSISRKAPDGSVGRKCSECRRDSVIKNFHSGRHRARLARNLSRGAGKTFPKITAALTLADKKHNFSASNKKLFSKDFFFINAHERTIIFFNEPVLAHLYILNGPISVHS